MKTIEERSKEYREEFLKSFFKSLEELSFYDISDAYTKGATDQAEITKQEMLDKACKTYCRFCPHQCESYPHDDCQIQIEFRKAMEE